MTNHAMQIRPIRTEHDYDEALARMTRIMGSLPGSPQGDELEVLATLVNAYETKHFPVDAPDPITAIEFRMEQQGLSRKDLESFIGSRARVSEILTRKRSLTLPMVRRLRNGLGISADVLIDLRPVRASGAKPNTRRRRQRS